MHNLRREINADVQYTYKGRTKDSLCKPHSYTVFKKDRKNKKHSLRSHRENGIIAV
jgi:hypothetical protein